MKEKKEKTYSKRYVIQQIIGQCRHIDLRPEYETDDIERLKKHLKLCRDDARGKIKFRVISRETEIVETEMEW